MASDESHSMGAGHRHHHADLVKHNQNHFDAQSANWDDPEYVQVARESYAAILQHLGQFISRDDTRVLNFGCGSGLLESQLRHDVKHVTGVDISSGMVERMRHKIENEDWHNVKVVQADVLDEDAAAKHLQPGGFDLVVSCYTFHHLQDVSAIGKQLIRYLKPGGYLCIIDFAAGDRDESKSFHSHLSESAKASIGTHDGFSEEFLLCFYRDELQLKNLHVHPACPLKCGEDEYSTTIAFGQK